MQQARGEFNDENNQLQVVFRGQSDKNMSLDARNADKSKFRIPLHCCACINYLTIRPVALSGYGSIAHEAKPNGLMTRGP